MDIPPSSHKAWKDLVVTDTSHTFEYLALQMLLKRLKVKVLLDPTPDKIDRAIDELHDMFCENIKLPKVQRDLEKIFKKKGGLS